MTKTKIDLLVADSWEQLPDVWKFVNKVRPIDFYAGIKKDGIKDKGLLKLVEPYLGKDDLRPNMEGAYVDKNVIYGTDSHKLISLPADLDVESGLYNINPKNKGYKLYEKINATPPPYESIFNTQSIITKVDLYKLKTYVDAVINGKYANFVTNAISFKVNDEISIGFNGKMLNETIDTFLLLGYTELFFGFRSERTGVLISPNENTAKDPKANIGNYPFAFLMPLLIENNGGLGARDMDMGTEINVYFSFEDNEIYNKDKSVAKFDKNLTDTDLPYIDSESFDLLNRLIPKKYKNLLITEYIKVQNNKATITDLDFFLEVKDVFVEDGIYEICNGAFKNTETKMDDFPLMKREGESLTPLAKIDTDSLRQRTKEALPFISDDQLRQSLTCLSLQLGTGNNLDSVKVYGTNAHIMLRSEFIINEVSSKELKLLVPKPKFLSYFLDAVKDSKVDVLAKYFNEDKKKTDRLFFETSNYNYSIKIEESPTPDYDSVIDSNVDSYISFNTVEMISIINSLKGEDAKQNLYLDFGNESKDRGYFEVKLQSTSYQNYKITKSVGKVNCVIIKSDQKPNKNVALIMTTNTNDTNSFGFSPKYLKTILMLGDKNEAILHFDSKKPMPQFITELRPVQGIKTTDSVKKITKVQEVVESKPSKEDVIKTIKALKFLADAGNKDAEKTIKSLKFLI